MRRTKIAAIGMFDNTISEATRWRPGTQCQAKYKRHFYDATIIRYMGEPGCQFRVEFDNYSICANVRVADLRERAPVAPPSRPSSPNAENHAPKVILVKQVPVSASSLYSNAKNVKKHCWEPPGGNPRQFGHNRNIHPEITHECD